MTRLRSTHIRSDARPVPAVVQELRAWCDAAGVSRSAIAMEAGVSASHLNQIINGRARPSDALLRRIADVLDRRKARGRRRRGAT
jgi:transcriptional regulator with XRE-family HTH domain